MQKEAVEINGLKVSYEDDKWVLRDVNLSINEGEVVVIVGRNGSGKTTLLRTIASLIPHLYKAHVEGSVKIYGISPLDNPEEIIRLVGYIGHELDSQILTYSVESELSLAAVLAGARDRGNIKNTIREVLRTVSAENIICKNTYELSGGEQAKLVIATNIIKKPRLLLLDEPTAFLDYESTIVFLDILRKLKHSNYTILIATHRLDLYRGIADRILVIEEGTVRAYEEISWSQPSIEKIEKKHKSIGKTSVIISAERLSFRYPRTSSYVLKDINMELRGKGLYIIVGRNGSGKTTLFKLLSGIYTPTSGRIKLEGKPLYIPQDPRLFFTYENLYRELVSKGIDINDKLLNRLGLASYLKVPIHKLSYGTLRKSAVSVGLLGPYNPIFLDEPTAGVDVESVIELLNIVSNAIYRKCIVIATHDQRIVDALSNLNPITYKLEDGLLRVVKDVKVYA